MGPILDMYSEVARLPAYFAYTYLRWILLERLLGHGVVNLPLILIDGDIVFNVDPAELEAEAAGKTFLLQGNPCFSAISDSAWFTVYARELQAYSRNPDSFRSIVEGIKKNPARPEREYCNAMEFSFPFRHEQDLQQFLIAAGHLPQDTAEKVLSSSAFYWAENPLYPGAWAAEQGMAPANCLVVERDRTLFVGERRLSFIHYQNDFAWYAHSWLRLHELGLGALTLRFRHDPTNRIVGGLLRRCDPLSRSYSRATMYQRTFANNPRSGNMFITDIINSRW
jgi:hypothetical protein